MKWFCSVHGRTEQVEPCCIGAVELLDEPADRADLTVAQIDLLQSQIENRLLYIARSSAALETRLDVLSSIQRKTQYLLDTLVKRSG